MAISSLEFVLRRASQGLEPLSAPASVQDYWVTVAPKLESARTSMARALLAGFWAERPAYAYVGGLQAALSRLYQAGTGLEPRSPGVSLQDAARVSIPEELTGEGHERTSPPLMALCITEEGGGHPRAIQTELVVCPAGGYTLSGQKKFITVGPQAGVLLVAARAPQSGEGPHPLLRLVRIPARAVGVTVEVMPALPVLPEIEHARLKLEQVWVAGADILPGDGYTSYIKPFRTLEDAHVSVALLGHLFRVAGEYEWPEEALEELASVTVGLMALGDASPDLVSVHVGLAGFFRQQEQLLERLLPCWSSVPDEIRLRWERDFQLRQFAGKVREMRTASAWKRLRGENAAAESFSVPGSSA